MTKSIWPSSDTQRSAAPLRLSNCWRDGDRLAYAIEKTGWSSYIPHIHGTDAQDLCTLAHSGELARHTLRLLDIAANDTGVGAEID